MWHGTHQQVWKMWWFEGLEHKVVFHILYLVHDDLEQINGAAEHSRVSASGFEILGGLVSLHKAQH